MRIIIFSCLCLLYMDTAFAKSCLDELPAEHHAIIASYDNDKNCIIKTCIPTYKLFKNHCYNKEEYATMVEKEQICKNSGGEFDIVFNVPKCKCLGNMFAIDNTKCIKYDDDDCKTNDVVIQHIKRNNLTAVKNCIDKNKEILKNKIEYAIDTALETHNYSILDALLDNNLADLTDLTHHSAGGWGGHRTGIDYLIYASVLGKDNFALIKYLIDDKKVIDLHEKYSTKTDSPFSYTNYFAEFIIQHQLEYSGDTNNAYKILDYLLHHKDFDANEVDILGHIMNTATSLKGYCEFDYLKYARTQGLKFKLIDGNNPLDYLYPAYNVQAQEYNWLITEIKKDLPNIDFTNALLTFCEKDYVYGPPPRTLEQDKAIIKEFMNAGANINNDIIQAAKVYQEQSVNSWKDKVSHKFEAICSFVPENEMCLKQKTEMHRSENNHKDTNNKEMSTANRMLSGLSMAATGIGGMQMAQGLAEQSADADAARDMDAYLATMQCRVGNNKYKLGESGIDVGGANQLTELYQQYVDLAADLKERKTALGMKAGIESSVIMDSAHMGLYDDKGSGVTNGTYASLYRAARGNEKDQKKLAEQKQSASDKVKGGAIAAGVGVVGGLIGNELINGDDDYFGTDAQ